MAKRVVNKFKLRHVSVNLPNEQWNERPRISRVLFECEEQLKSGHGVGVAFDRADFPAFLFTFEIQVQSASSVRTEKKFISYFSRYVFQKNIIISRMGKKKQMS